MKMKLFIASLIIVGLQAIPLVAKANVVLLNDSFDGSTLSTNWVKQLNSTITVSGGSVTLNNVATTSMHRAYITRNTDSSGNTLYDSKAVYNFYDHALTASAQITNLVGVSTNNAISYFIGIGSTANLMDITPWTVTNGVFVEVTRNANGTYGMTMTERVNNVATRTALGLVNVKPTGIDVVFDKNAWSFTMTGAHFAGGSFINTSSASGSFASISEGNFSNFYLAAGSYQLGAITTAASMDIQNIQVTTIPEPTTISLFVISAAGLILLRRVSAGR